MSKRKKTKYTVCCRPDRTPEPAGETSWFGMVKAHDLAAAMDKALAMCAADWGVPISQLRVALVLRGDVEVLVCQKF